MSAASTWRWIRSGAGGPAFNMALDEVLLRSAGERPTLRTYRWDPWSLSLGYFQDVSADELAPWREKGYGVVRRPTGGRAIFHGDELTYSVAWPVGSGDLPRNAVGAYEVVHGALIRALKRSGVRSEPRGDRRLLSDSDTGAGEFLCFYHSSEFDLVLEGRKLVGSAQRRSGRGLLMHGSIPCGPNPVTPEAAHTGISPGELESTFAEELAAVLGVEFVPGAPTAGEREAARNLEGGKYGRDSFTIRRA